MVCFSNYAHRTRTESTSADSRGSSAKLPKYDFLHQSCTFRAAVWVNVTTWIPGPVLWFARSEVSACSWKVLFTRRAVNETTIFGLSCKVVHTRWSFPVNLAPHSIVLLISFCFFIVAYVSISTCMKLKHLAHIDLIELPAVFQWTQVRTKWPIFYGHFQIQYINFGIPLPHKKKISEAVSSSLLHLIH